MGVLFFPMYLARVRQIGAFTQIRKALLVLDEKYVRQHLILLLGSYKFTKSQDRYLISIRYQYARTYDSVLRKRVF